MCKYLSNIFIKMNIKENLMHVMVFSLLPGSIDICSDKCIVVLNILFNFSFKITKVEKILSFTAQNNIFNFYSFLLLLLIIY